MAEVGQDEWEVFADGRAAGGGGEIGGEIDGVRRAVFRDAEDVVACAGQGEECEEVVFGEVFEFLLEPEVVKKDVGFERILGLLEGDDVVAAALEVVSVCGEIAGEISLGAGAELGEVGEVEFGVEPECGMEPEELGELL